MSNIDTRQILADVLNSINDWLKYAEGKNAALLVANSAIVFGILQCSQFSKMPSWAMFYVIGVIFLLVISAVFCLISFIPKIELPWISSLRKCNEEDNLLFYTHVACYEPKEYLKALTGKNEFSRIEEDFAEQIIINARIALGKFSYFRVAIWITVTAIVTPVIALIIYLLDKK